MINLNQSPTKNALDARINLCNNGVVTAVLDPGGADVINAMFDEVRMLNPPHMPHQYHQLTPGVFASNPGDITIIERLPNGVAVSFGPPGAPAQNVRFQ